MITAVPASLVPGVLAGGALHQVMHVASGDFADGHARCATKPYQSCSDAYSLDLQDPSLSFAGCDGRTGNFRLAYA
ncbi:hypothetical protein [Mycobacterium sp. 852002-30065_SCH5024008]|uniref:hypothetical protein n=1 Tax=Mycobacterium sp. 852002-30065_SCH5024008 TaxID=1834088 RepID=UPI0012E83DDD|nr:hypothetical protein [Mycobacterium sp. 852002-30065_SCH5024008]